MKYEAKILWGMGLEAIDTEIAEIAKAEYEGKAVDRPRMWDLLETKKRYLAAQARLNEQQNKDNRFTEITTETIYNEIKNEEEKTMSNTFKSITGITYTSNDLQTRFYTIDAEGKKTRISRKAYEEARKDYNEEKLAEKIDAKWDEHTEKVAEEAKAEREEQQTDEAWEAEAEAERKAREAKIAEDAKATEDAVNGIVATLTEKGKKKAKKEKTSKKDQSKAETKKTRKSKDIAHEHKDGEVTITLTAKQVDFVLHLSDSCFWEQGLDSVLWCDVLVDEIGGQFEGKPMTIGAMISTLCEKGLGIRTKDRLTDATTGKSRKSTTFQLTEKGKEIAKELGLK
jgi:chemotaxis protein histidine kinase CheA